LSIGVAEWSEGKTIDQLLDDADREMYAAKAEHPLNKGKPNLAKAAEQTGFEQRRVLSDNCAHILDNVEY
jgi:GGDEF domain-containing protein